MIVRFALVAVAAPFVALWLKVVGREACADSVGARWAVWVKGGDCA